MRRSSTLTLVQLKGPLFVNLFANPFSGGMGRDLHEAEISESEAGLIWRVTQ